MEKENFKNRQEWGGGPFLDGCDLLTLTTDGVATPLSSFGTLLVCPVNSISTKKEQKEKPSKIQANSVKKQP